MTIALGITTFNRPSYAERCIKSILKHLDSQTDFIAVHDDGSDAKHNGAYKRAVKPLQKRLDDSRAVLQVGGPNRGVAASKNALLRYFLDETDAEYIFLVEDDILVKSDEVLQRYIEATTTTGIAHFSFNAHGPANANGPVAIDDGVAYYPHSIGAFCSYTRECLETVGLFDESFHNAWEHVCFDMELMRGGFMPGADVHRFPDIVGSSELLTEIPGSIDRSSIRERDDWSSSIRDGLIYWRDNKPDTFAMIFGDNCPLHNYAMSIIG